jgi:hypothetical protein
MREISPTYNFKTTLANVRELYCAGGQTDRKADTRKPVLKYFIWKEAE